jgi:hypothetical protein
MHSGSPAAVGWHELRWSRGPGPLSSAYGLVRQAVGGVKRVLKGKLSDKIITTRTPTAAAEFIGKEWVIMWSPEYVAGKHQFANCNWIKDEPDVKAILSKEER